MLVKIMRKHHTLLRVSAMRFGADHHDHHDVHIDRDATWVKFNTVTKHLYIRVATCWLSMGSKTQTFQPLDWSTLILLLTAEGRDSLTEMRFSMGILSTTQLNMNSMPLNPKATCLMMSPTTLDSI